MKEEDLPLLLPDVAEYEPTENGESPLANITSWVNTTCPHCGGKAKRETDTMPNWAGSSWYFLRFMDPHNNKEFASMNAMKYWKQVDWYNGGMEHTARHLLYARFWVQFLYNIGLVPRKEMIWTRVSHGMVLGSNNEKMSKSKGNVINPDDIIKEYGAIDILVNNAGITRDNLILRMSESEFDDVIRTNLKGTFNCIKHVTKYMLKNKSGKIINISSISGVNGIAGQANYSASKAGIIGLTKSFAKEMSSKGININAIAPGFIETDMTKVLNDKYVEEIVNTIPSKRVGRPEDIAKAALFLASDMSDYITGQTLMVDGGLGL